MEKPTRRGAFKLLGAVVIAASAFGAGVAEAQWAPPPPGWHRPPPPGGWHRPPPPPPGAWRGPPPHGGWGRRWVCWWRSTPWGPRRVCGWR